MINKYFFGFLILVFLSSCASRERLVYFQNKIEGAEKKNDSNYESKFKPDDLLEINVSAPDAEASIPFNLSVASNSNGTTQFQSYLIDSNGNIEFPILGTLKVGGLSREELNTLLKSSLQQYIKNPIINIRILNYKVSVNGEVYKPGTFPIHSERVTLVEALSMAGDLTIYGRRDNIIVIRDIEGMKTINRVDITKTDFIHSDFYYLTQNDVVYVEPNKTKINSSVIGPNISIFIALTSLLVTIFVLFIK